MFDSPGTQTIHEVNQFATGLRQGIFDPKRFYRSSFSTHNPVLFQTLQLGRQHLFADSGEKISEFSKSLGTECQVPNNLNLPFACYNRGGRAHRASPKRNRASPGLHEPLQLGMTIAEYRAYLFVRTRKAIHFSLLSPR